VVLGCEAARVRGEVDLGDARVVENLAWRTGTGSAVRAGLGALAGDDGPAVLLMWADMPGVTVDAVRRLVEGADERVLRAATYGGRRGYPVLAGREHWAGMATLASSDTGARAYLSAHSNIVAPVPCEDVADDTEYDIPVPS
jgi:CTP:molybdopterin cytidylyltransferase MocA